MWNEGVPCPWEFDFIWGDVLNKAMGDSIARDKVWQRAGQYLCVMDKIHAALTHSRCIQRDWQCHHDCLTDTSAVTVSPYAYGYDVAVNTD